MKQRIIGGLVMMVLVLPFSVISAEENNESVSGSSSSSSSSSSSGGARPTIKERLEIQRKNNERDLKQNALQASMTRSTTSSRMLEKREERRENIEERRENIEERRDERRDEMKQRILDRVMLHVERVIKRLTATVERLEKITDRIDSRISTLQNEGLDMSAAKAETESARTNLAAALVEIGHIQGIANTVLASSTPREKWNTVETAIKEAKDKIKAAERDLREAIAAIKKIRRADDDTDTTAPNN